MVRCCTVLCSGVVVWRWVVESCCCVALLLGWVVLVSCHCVVLCCCVVVWGCGVVLGC